MRRLRGWSLLSLGLLGPGVARAALALLLSTEALPRSVFSFALFALVDVASALVAGVVLGIFIDVIGGVQRYAGAFAIFRAAIVLMTWPAPFFLHDDPLHQPEAFVGMMGLFEVGVLGLLLLAVPRGVLRWSALVGTVGVAVALGFATAAWMPGTLSTTWLLVGSAMASGAAIAGWLPALRILADNAALESGPLPDPLAGTPPD